MKNVIIIGAGGHIAGHVIDILAKDEKVNLIRENFHFDWKPVLFKGHTLVHLPEMMGDFLPRYHKAKNKLRNV